MFNACHTHDFVIILAASSWPVHVTRLCFSRLLRAWVAWNMSSVELELHPLLKQLRLLLDPGPGAQGASALQEVMQYIYIYIYYLDGPLCMLSQMLGK